MSVGRMDFFTLQGHGSRAPALIVPKYSATAEPSTRTFPDPAQWRSFPFFLTPENQNRSPGRLTIELPPDSPRRCPFRFIRPRALKYKVRPVIDQSTCRIQVVPRAQISLFGPS